MTPNNPQSHDHSFEWLNGLNDKQRTAVELPATSSLIIAGAGSGKTKVLTSRVAYLIQTGMARPEDIMAVTFTNKAAKEMLERLEKIGVHTKGMWVGTFHGICNRFLRRFHQAAGLPASFQILDVDDSKQILKRVFKTKGWSEDQLSVKECYNFISSQKEAGTRPDRKPIPPAYARGSMARLKEAFVAYEDQLKQEGAVDFPELMLKTVELLQDDEKIRFWAQDRFKFMLVDEFQDTNKLQYRWIKLMTGLINPVFAVGDDDQSIYAFRGAKVENMQSFLTDFGIGDRIVRLEQNYRSQGNILKAANALIGLNSGRMGKNLWTDKGEGRLIHFKEAFNETEEASFMASESLRLKEEGVDLKEIAFLYRTNAQSRVLEHALFHAGLAYKVYGGLRFFERAEVKHAMSYLRLTANPLDDSALLRVINFPTRGIGAKTIERISSEATSKGISLWQSINESVGTETGKAKTGLMSFITLIEKLKSDTLSLSLGQLMQQVITASGLMALYEAEKEGQDRVDNLKELVTAARTFTMNPMGDDVSLEAFLANAALEAGEHGAKDGESAIQLMTVHSAKGLEFNHVFISGLEEGIFPHMNSAGDPAALEEERRLMYVALTRARTELTLLRAKERALYGGSNHQLPSQFLEEIPSELLFKHAKPTRAVGSWNDSDGHGNSGYQKQGYTYSSGLKKNEGGKVKSIFAKAADPNDPFAVGKRVFHAKFGEGIIRDRSGDGADLALEVDFKEAGKRRLIAKFAKLEPVK